MLHMSGTVIPRKFNAVPIQNYFTKQPEIGEIFYFTFPGRSGLHIYTQEGWTRIVTHHQYISEVFDTEDKQTIFVLTKAKYVTDGTGLQIFRNGLKLAPRDYVEADSFTIVLKEECKEGDQVEIIVVNSPSFTTELVKDSSETETEVLSQANMNESFVGDAEAEPRLVEVPVVVDIPEPKVEIIPEKKPVFSKPAVLTLRSGSDAT